MAESESGGCSVREAGGGRLGSGLAGLLFLKAEGSPVKMIGSEESQKWV